MNTLPKWKQLRLRRLGLMKSPVSIRKTMRRWKAALIGLLMICITAISGCASRSSLPVDSSKVTVDASLMVPSNYTSQLLEVLSQ